MADITVAVLQYRCEPEIADQNRRRSLEQLEAAVERGARLAVLPELCQSGYDLSPEAARSVAETLDGPTVQAWSNIARQREMYVVGGLCERDGERIFNSAVLVGPEGPIGSYRKAHLFDAEKDVFDPGDTGFPVFDTEIGRLGLLVCYDLRFPEALRMLSLRGVGLVAVPTCWVSPEGKQIDEMGLCIQAHCAMALCSMNRVYMACADTIGPYKETRFLGGSLIIGPDGWPLAGPAPVDEPAILDARVDLERTRERNLNPRNDLLADRRTDLYGRYPMERDESP